MKASAMSPPICVRAYTAAATSTIEMNTAVMGPLAPYATIVARTGWRILRPAPAASAQKIAHAVALFTQLGMAGVQSRAAEGIDRKILHDLIIAILADDRIRIDHTFGNAIAAIGGHGHADPVARGAAEHPVVHVIDGGGGGGGG